MKSQLVEPDPDDDFFIPARVTTGDEHQIDADWNKPHFAPSLHHNHNMDNKASSSPSSPMVREYELVMEHRSGRGYDSNVMFFFLSMLKEIHHAEWVAHSIMVCRLKFTVTFGQVGRLLCEVKHNASELRFVMSLNHGDVRVPPRSQPAGQGKCVFLFNFQCVMIVGDCCFIIQIDLIALV